MGLLDIFKRKKRQSEKDELMDKMAAFLFGSLDEMRSQISELDAALGHRYDLGQVAGALTWMTTKFLRGGDVSAAGLVDNGQMRRPNNIFKRDDAMTIYKFVVKKSLCKTMPGASDEVVEMMLPSLGNNEGGATSDVIPGAYGEYGLCVTNPVPTKGIPSNEAYLRRLSLLSGEPFHWERIGSFGAPNIQHPIDGYDIITESGETLCTIYISPYQNIISNKAPKGFYLKS